MSFFFYLYVFGAALFAFFALGQFVIWAIATQQRVKNYFYTRALLGSLAVTVSISLIIAATKAA